MTVTGSGLPSVKWYISREPCPECSAQPQEPCQLSRGTFHHARVDRGTAARTAAIRRRADR